MAPTRRLTGLFFSRRRDASSFCKSGASRERSRERCINACALATETGRTASGSNTVSGHPYQRGHPLLQVKLRTLRALDFQPRSTLDSSIVQQNLFALYNNLVTGRRV